MSAHRRPFASSTPSRWLRDSGEPHVAMTSPIPASPANVSGFAPAAIPTRVISARPRVMSPALPLSPKPSSSAAPAAIARTFLSAPHSSTPTRSLLTYSRNRRRPRRAWTRAASASSSAATTADAGSPRAISRARFGPDSAAIRRGSTPPASAMTSLIRRSVPSSRPLTTETRSAAGGRKRRDPDHLGPQVARRDGEHDELRDREHRGVGRDGRAGPGTRCRADGGR